VFCIRKNTKGKKAIIAYNTLFGMGVMKQYVKYEHFELLTTFVEEVAIVHNISGSQIIGAVRPCSKPKNVPK
jgi:hypothetical protein